MNIKSFLTGVIVGAATAIVTSRLFSLSSIHYIERRDCPFFGIRYDHGKTRYLTHDGWLTEGQYSVYRARQVGIDIEPEDKNDELPSVKAAKSLKNSQKVFVPPSPNDVEKLDIRPEPDPAAGPQR